MLILLTAFGYIPPMSRYPTCMSPCPDLENGVFVQLWCFDKCECMYAHVSGKLPVRAVQQHVYTK